MLPGCAAPLGVGPLWWPGLLYWCVARRAVQASCADVSTAAVVGCRILVLGLSRWPFVVCSCLARLRCRAFCVCAWPSCSFSHAPLACPFVFFLLEVAILPPHAFSASQDQKPAARVRSSLVFSVRAHLLFDGRRLRLPLRSLFLFRGCCSPAPSFPWFSRCFFAACLLAAR